MSHIVARGGFALLALGGIAAEARAQGTALPEIVASSPSPIVPKASTGPAAAPDLPIGVLPVVTDSFAPVTVVTRGEIERETPRTLTDALADKPGISGSGYAPGAADRPIIRGLDNNRVRIQENGVGVQDVSALGEDHGVPINPLVQDRIEVVRGPATLRYGSQGIGGVVSAENNRIPSFIPQNGVTGRFLSGYSSAGNGALGAASVDAGGGNAAFHADGCKTSAGDYGTPRGRQWNSGSESQGGAAGFSFIGPDGFVGLSWSHYDALYRIPGGDAAASRTRLDPRQDKLMAKGEVRFQSGPFEALRFWFGGSNYRHDERGIGPNGIDGIQATFKNREYEGRLELQHIPVFVGLGTLTGAAGVQASRGQIRTSGEAGGLLAPARTESVAGYVFEQLALEQGWKLQASGRIEGTRVTGTPSLFPSTYLPSFSPTGDVDQDGNPVLAPDAVDSARRRRDFMPMSAAFGVLKDLPEGFVASLTGQYVERAPSAPELYSRGSHDATATFEIGNPNLKLERARTIELGLRRSEGPVRFDATGYYTRYTGFIYKRLTGVTCGDDFASCGTGTELQQIVYSQRNASFFGAEIGAQLDVIPVGAGFIGVDARYDFVHARFDDGTYVPRIPPHRVGGGLFFRDGNWFARIGILHAFDHTETAPNETRTKGWDNLKAELSYTRPLDRARYGLSEMTIGLKADNLLNADIRNSASFKKDEILMPGRNVRLFLSARF